MTGVRIRQKNGIFFLQPQVSKLIGVSRVERNSTKWLDLPDPRWDGSEFENTFTLSSDNENSMKLGRCLLNPNEYITGNLYFKNCTQRKSPIILL